MTTRNQEIIEPIAQLKHLQSYACQESEYPLALKLNANEGPIRELGFEFANGHSHNRYPDARKVERLIADRFGITNNQVIVTAGGDEAIDRVCRAYLTNGRNIIVPEPSFEMIRKYATMSGAEVRPVTWDDEFPVQEIIAASDENTVVVAIVSPNNPTGKVVDNQTVAQLAAALPATIMLVDQAYAEFEDEGDRESLSDFVLREIENAVVIRTFSKAWGLAGLRVGFACGRPSLIDNLRKVGGPYSVSAYSLAAVEHLLQSQCGSQLIYPELVKSERVELENQLRSFGCKVSNSQGNFVFAELNECSINSDFLFRAMAARGVLIRHFHDINAVRITCPGQADEFQSLADAIASVFAPQAVLFDMDGVLVDESASYREAIRQTCQSFGFDVSTKEIAGMKLLGNANNDWIFTQRLLFENGLELRLSTVRDRFEAIYQGDSENSGLWDRETCLVDKAWLADISERYPLGIVTGRPKQDALRFLENEGIAQLFSTIITLDDGPTKPDPFNVRLAMGELGVDSAWMIGDTPDDVNAARNAGIVALGIVAPSDNQDFVVPKLLHAGAAVVVSGLEQFGELLP